MQDTYNRFKKHTILDRLIFKLSKENAIFESVVFKMWLLRQKKGYVSNLNPIVIGGCPRSGTTLARALIGMHPEIASPKNEYNILMWTRKKNVLQNVFNFTNGEINELLNSYNDYIMFSEQVLRLFMQKEGKSHIALKHPFQILIIDKIFKYFPETKFVHVIRDGRDATCSLRTHPKRKIVNGKISPTYVKNPFDWCVRRWIACINNGKKWRNSDNYIEIKYEDLVNKTIPTMKIVFSFLNLEMVPEDNLLSFYKTEKDDKHLQNIEVGLPIYKKTIGRWHNDMSLKEKDLLKRKAGKLLIELEYEKNMDW
jgi:protein-tyrosine sulfotransferase